MAIGISVSPALVRLDLAENPPQFTLTYTNNSNQALTINLSTKDFTGLEEGWRINFLDNADPQTYRYSLSSWLKFDPENFLLLPSRTKTVKVNIRTTDLASGGHYASIIAAFTPGVSATPSAVTINSQLVSLVFVRANTGLEREEANINSFSPIITSKLSLPEKYLLRLDNSGNTEMVPRGVVIVRDLRNREVARGILNQEGAITLPESVRRYEIPITIKQSIYPLPGPYQATLTVNYSNQSLLSSVQFFSFGNPLNVTIIILLIIITLALVLNKMKRR